MVAIYNRTWKFSFEGNFHFDFNKNNHLFKREDFIFTISLPKYLGGEEKEEKKKKKENLVHGHLIACKDIDLIIVDIAFFAKRKI